MNSLLNYARQSGFYASFQDGSQVAIPVSWTKFVLCSTIAEVNEQLVKREEFNKSHSN